MKEARVSEILHDVKLLPQQAPARPAVLSDQVKDGTAVRTGADSRAELTFTDQTLARLGSNTIFSFNEGTRNLQLGGGAMLLRVPKDAGGAQISTAAITAAITGTTVMLEYHPNAYSKFIVLEGTGRIFRGDRVGESVLVNAGQMMIVNPTSKTLPNPVDVDIKRLMKTSSLVKKFKPLASNKLIDHEIGTQTAMKAKGGLIETNLVIFGSGTAVTLLDPTTTGVLDQANANDLRGTPSPSPTPIPPTPTPTPTKTGTPSVIGSSTYQINSGTIINTDPTITTNNQVDYGKIYTAKTEKLSLSAWLFGSTSDFDGTIGFDNLTQFGADPIATFKFFGLSLNGDPQIVIPKGAPDSLALISVGDITSGLPGGALTFVGLNLLLLATQNGSIFLTPDISFENIPNLAIYARGSDSDLNLDAPILGSINLALAAQRDINVAGSFDILQAGTGPLASGPNFLMIAGRDINIGNDLRLTTQPNDETDHGGTITINAGRDVAIQGVSVIDLDNSNGGNIADDGVISIQVPAGTFHADSDIVFRIHNETDPVTGAPGGVIQGSATIMGNFLSLTGDSSIDAAISNWKGTINGGANIDFTFTNDLDVAGEASFRILNQDAGFGGGNIAGAAMIDVNSAFGFQAGSISAQINNLGGTIGGASTINFTTNPDFGDITSNLDATFKILEDAPNEAGSTINVSAHSISTGGSLTARIGNAQTAFDFENVVVSAADTISVGNQLLVDGIVSAGGDISVGNGISVAGDLTSDSGNITSTFGNITVGGNIAAFGAPSISDGPIVSAGGSITAQSIMAGTVTTGSGNLTIDNSAGSSGFLSANTIDIAGNLVMTNASSISPNGGTSDGVILVTPFDLTLNATRIISMGPVFPALTSNGTDANFGSGNNNPGNGGVVNLNISGGLTIGSTSDLTSITANGGAFISNSLFGGNGGTINIASSGDVTLNGDVTATTGEFLGTSPGILGNGGTVNITTSGAIAVSSKVEVSSASTTTPIRRSAKGGNVTLTSNKSSPGPAITIANSGQLLALLDAAAPGPGGKITVVANGSGGNSVNVNGTVTASKGTVEVRHNGANGTVNISDASGLNTALLSGDVVKVGALGTDGVLTVGRGTLSANDTLKLYGASANGQVRFVDNVTIGGQNFTIIAADTVTINNGKIVTVNGARADVYTGFIDGVPKANYTGFGGNNSTTGTFAGAGANNPQPIANAPPFDGPPGG